MAEERGTGWNICGACPVSAAQDLARHIRPPSRPAPSRPAGAERRIFVRAPAPVYSPRQGVIYRRGCPCRPEPILLRLPAEAGPTQAGPTQAEDSRSEEHTSELQSLMRIS